MPLFIKIFSSLKNKKAKHFCLAFLVSKMLRTNLNVLRTELSDELRAFRIFFFQPYESHE